MATDVHIEPAPPASRADRGRAADQRWIASTGVSLLVVDPEWGRVPEIAASLQSAGLSLTSCGDGAEALVRFGEAHRDAVLLAARLPLVDAATVVTTLRKRGDQPILLSVGPDDVEYAAPAVVAGATTVVGRPYSANEILQRLDAHLPDIDARLRLVYGPLELDPRAYAVRLDGKELHELPLKEFELLRLLMTHADHVVTPTQIKEALWHSASHTPSSNAVTAHIRRLRGHLHSPVELRTIRGLGYRLTVVSTTASTDADADRPAAG